MKILFQGDSITDAGRDRLMPQHLGNGYVSEIAMHLNMIVKLTKIKQENNFLRARG